MNIFNGRVVYIYLYSPFFLLFPLFPEIGVSNLFRRPVEFTVLLIMWNHQ